MPQVDMSDFKKGLVFELDGEPMTVLNTSHSVQGRGSGVTKAKVRNIKTGAVREITVKGGDKFEAIEVVNQMAQFLYESGGTYTFMDSETYEQTEFDADQLEDAVNYLTDGLNVHLTQIDGTPIGVVLPPKVELEVKETPPGVKGDTAQGGTKPAKLETGYTLQVPLFIKEGEKIRVNTDTGEYVERVS